jgi:hypothetical protein
LVTETFEPERVDQAISALQRHGYRIDGAKFPTGRPDRLTVPVRTRFDQPAVAKCYPSDRGALTFANMQSLWRSSFGERRRPPGLPEPIDYLPETGTLVMERLSGRPLAEREAADAVSIAEAVKLIAALHDCEARPTKKRDRRRIVREIQRNQAASAEMAPAPARVLAPVVEALEASDGEDTEIVPCHGDFSPRNVLIGGARVALIDWDRLEWADPARDVTYFGTWCWVWALRRKMTADWSVLQQAIEGYRGLRQMTLTDARRDFHVAAGLMRIAHGMIRFWPSDVHLIPQLAAEALRRLR